MQPMLRESRSVEAKIVAVYILFWSAWLVFDFASGYGLGPATVGLVLLSFAGFLAGRLSRRRPTPIALPPAVAQQRLRSLLRSVLLLNLMILAAAIPSILSLGFDHRSLMFTDEGVFGQVALTFFYNYAVQPLNYAAVVIAMVSRRDDLRLERYAYLILAAMALMALGRFPIYFIIYFYIVSQLIAWTTTRPNIPRLLRLSVIVSAVLYLSWLLLATKLQEEGADVDEVGTVLKIYLLNYHVVGYHMLDYFLYAQDSRIVEYPFPTTSMGVMGWLLHLVSKYSLVLPEFPNSFKSVMEMFNQGVYLPELEWSYNAFTTSILPFYADGGLVGVLLGSVLLGWLSTRGRRLDSQPVAPVFLMVCFALTFSLFQPIVQAELPTNLLFLYFCNRFLLRGWRSYAG